MAIYRDNEGDIEIRANRIGDDYAAIFATTEPVEFGPLELVSLEEIQARHAERSAADEETILRLRAERNGWRQLAEARWDDKVGLICTLGMLALLVLAVMFSK